MGEESFQECFFNNLGRLLVLRSAEKEYQLAEGGRRKGNVCSSVWRWKKVKVLGPFFILKVLRKYWTKKIMLYKILLKTTFYEASFCWHFFTLLRHNRGEFSMRCSFHLSSPVIMCWGTTDFTWVGHTAAEIIVLWIITDYFRAVRRPYI